MHSKTLYCRGSGVSEGCAERRGGHKDVRNNPPDGVRHNIRNSGRVAALPPGRVFTRDRGASGCGLLYPASSQSEGALR
jgi:hypothetical protein